MTKSVHVDTSKETESKLKETEKKLKEIMQKFSIFETEYNDIKKKNETIIMDLKYKNETLNEFIIDLEKKLKDTDKKKPKKSTKNIKHEALMKLLKLINESESDDDTDSESADFDNDTDGDIDDDTDDGSHSFI